MNIADVKQFLLWWFLVYCHASTVSVENTCNVNNIPSNSAFDILKFLGEWHNVKTTTYRYGADTFTSKITHYFTTTEKQLIMADSGFNNKTGRCADPGFYILNEISPGKYTLNFGVNKGVYLIVYTDYEYAVTLWCSSIEADGQCPRQHIHIAILSRNRTPPVNMWTKLEQHLVCDVSSTHMIDNIPGLCELPDDYLTSIGYVGWGDGSAHRCGAGRRDRIPVHSGFQLHKFIGEWYSVTTTLYRYGWKTLREESLVFFTDGHNELMLAVRGGIHGQCSESIIINLEEEMPGKYFAHTSSSTGLFQVIYTDNQYAITYSCSKLDNDGHCEKRYENFAVITRANPALKSRISDLENYIINFCINIETDTRKQTKGSCAVSKTFLAKHGFYKGCPVQNIPVEADFDKMWFLGPWHIIKTSATVLPGNSIYLTAMQNYFINADGHLETAYIGYLDSLDICLKPGTIVFEEISPGEFSFNSQAGKGYFKILYTDYNYAVTYSCRQTDDSGKCVKQVRHVSILSRKPAITEEALQELEKHAWIACVNSSELKHVSYDLCSIPEDFLNTARGDVKDPCQHSSIHIHENFELSRFLGVWNLIWTTYDMHKNGTYLSSTFNFLMNAEHEAVMIVTRYKLPSEECTEPEVYYMQQLSPGHYLVNQGKGAMKVIFSDYSKAVMYACIQQDIGQYCAKENTRISIFSRDYTISETEFNSLQKYITFLKICTQAADLVEAYSGMCSLSQRYKQTIGYTFPVSDECNGIVKQQSVDLSQISGEWFLMQSNHVYSPQEKILLSKGPVLWDIKEHGFRFFYRTWNKTSGKCVETYVSHMNELSSSGHYGISTERYRVSLKILYFDSKSMMTSTCRKGNCSTDNMIVEVWTRSNEMSVEQLRHLKRVMAAACFDTNSLTVADSGICPVPKTVIDFVRSGQFEQEHAAVGCNLDHLPAVKHFNGSTISGAWYIQYSTKDVFSVGEISQGPVHFVSHGNLTFLYRMWSGDDSICKPAEADTYFVTNISGSYTFSFEGQIGHFKILSLDKSMALIYYCLGVNNDGSCSDGKATFKVLTRTQATLANSDIEVAKMMLRDICLDAESLVRITSGTCPMPEHIVKDENLGRILPAHFAIGCQVKHIQHQNIPHPEKMSGEWYTVYTSNSVYTLGPWRWVPRNDGFLFLWSTLHNNKICKPVEALYMTENKDVGGYSFKMGTTGLFKIVYNDYQVFVSVTCLLVTDDGFCADDQMIVRINTRTIDYNYEHLLQHVSDACTDYNKLHKNTQGACPVSKDYVLPAAQGQLITEGHEVVGCRVKHFPVQKYFDLTRFSGKWYTVFSSRSVFPEGGSDVGQAHIVQHGTGLVYLWTKYDDAAGKCLTSEASYLELNTKPGSYSYNRPLEGSFKVLFTDYTHAVLHTCLTLMSNGDCQQNKTLIRIMSRNKQIASSVLQSLNKYVASSCIDPSELKQSTKVTCPVSKGIIQAAEKGLITKGYELVGCKTKYFSVPDHFDELKISGSWNVILSTPLPTFIYSDWTTYSQWIFVTSGDTKLKLQRGFNIRTKTCASTLSTVLTSASQPGAYFFYRKGFKVYFKFLYMDYTIGVGYYCIKHKTDGSCEDGFAVLVVISRQTDISEEHVGPLKQYISDTCLENRKFRKIERTICSIPEPILQAASDGKITEDGFIGCKMDFIVPQSQFDQSQVAGLWNLIWTTKDAGSTLGYGPISYVLSHTRLTIAWREYNESSGACNPTTILGMLKSVTDGEYTSARDLDVVKIIYLDSEYFVLYICEKVQMDGYCSKSKAGIELYSKHQTASERMLDQLRQFVSDVCVNPNSLHQLSLENCPVPENIIKAATDEAFSEGFMTVGCLTDYVPSQEYLDMSQFTGNNEWFTLLRSTSSFDGKPPSHKSQIVQTNNGDLFLLSRSYRSSHLACEPTEVLKLKERNGPGDYMFTLGGNVAWRGVFRILYADPNHAVTYSCFDSTPGIVCPADFLLVEVLSRSKEIRNITLKSLHAYINDGCVDPSTLLKVVPDLCHIPDTIVRATESIDFDYSIPIIGCDDQVIKHQEDLNLSTLTGIWHVQEQPAMMFGRPMGDSQTVHISLVTDGIVLLWQDFMSRQSGEDEMCQPTRASYLLQRAGPGDYAAVADHFTVVYKILYADSLHMVTYLCVGLKSDGTCGSGQMAVNILSRDVEITMETVNVLMSFYEGTCASVDDVITTTPDICQIPEDIIDAAEVGSITSEYTFIGCSIHFIKSQTVQVSELTGTWNAVIRPEVFLGSVIDHSKIISLHDLGGGNAMTLVVTYNSTSHVCQPVEQMKLIATGKAGEFVVHYIGKKGVTKVLYADKNESVWFTCFETQHDGFCKPGMSFFEIWSRYPTIDGTKLKTLTNYVTSVCSVIGKKQLAAPCMIPENIKRAAEIGSLTLDYAVTSFKTKFIPVQDHFQASKILGTWNVVYKTVYSDILNGQESIVFHFLLVPDGRLAMLWTSYSQSSAQCIPVEMRVLTETAKPGSYIYPIGNQRDGTLKFVFTDYSNTAVLYLCLEVGPDGICKKKKLQVNVLSRTVDIAADTLKVLQKYITASSVPIGDLHSVKTAGQCSVSLAIHKAAEKGTFTADHSQVGCHMDFINVHPVQMHQLEGLWTVKLGQPSNLQKVVHFTTSKDGSLVYLSVQYNSTSEMCHPVEYLKLQETSNGNFKGIKHGWPLYFKVLYSDGTELVTYICFQTKNDGTCNNTMVHLEILSNADVISDAKIMMLRKSATSVCMNDSMPIQTSIAPCVISIAMIEAATNGDIGADYVQVSCMHQFIPVQKDFDPDKFAGVWNNVKNIGGYDAISRTSYFAAHAHGILTEVYSIHDATNQNCSLPELVTHKQLGQPGEYTFTLNKTTGLMKILYTDYLTAVVYTCLEEAHDGTCKEDHAIIAVMARGSEISNSRMVELASFFKIGCVNIADAHISNGSCIITSHILEATNMKDIIEAVSKARPSTQCVLDKVVTVANFELIQMSGHWYELARTRYTFNRMESVVIYYNYNHSIHMLNGVYTGSMDGECQLPPITSLTKIDPSEKQVGVMGRIGGMTSSYPWVSFKILFFDGRFLMFYVCYENQTDGSCKQDQMEVTLLGRTPEKSKLIESLLPKLMSDVCLSQADLINTKREADCNSALFALPVHSRSRTFEIDPMKKCSSLADINVPGNFKEIEILGHWVGAAFLDLNTPERGRYGLTITVSRNTPTSLKMVINWRNEPQQTVILKQRCRGYGDYISTYSSSTMQQWSKVKILKTNANDVLVYWCTKELDGFCLASGARVDVLTRSSIYNKEELNALTGSIGDDCFPSARFLKPIDTEEYYSKFIAEASLVSGESVLSASPCTVDNIPTINIDTDRISGYWYEVSKTAGGLVEMNSFVCYYLPLGNGSLKFIFAGKGSSNTCNPMNGDLQPRCPSKPDGHFMGRINIPGQWSWTTWKVLYTDYGYATVAMSCMDEDQSGMCSQNGTQVHILSRTPTLAPFLRPIIDSHIRAACFNPANFVSSRQDGSCQSTLAEYVHQLQEKLSG